MHLYLCIRICVFVFVYLYLCIARMSSSCSLSTSRLLTSPPSFLTIAMAHILPPSCRPTFAGFCCVQRSKPYYRRGFIKKLVGKAYFSCKHCRMKMTARPCELGEGGHRPGGCVGCYHQCHPGHLGPTGLCGPQGAPPLGSWGASHKSTIPESTVTDALQD